MKHYLTPTQLDKLLKTAVILIDTREQENKHITDYFDKHKISYVSKKLDFGDYNIMLPKNLELNFPQDMVLDYAIERKNSLEEISGNLTQGRTAFENELIRGKEKMTLLIENSSMNDVITGNYNTEYDKRSFIASLLTFFTRYELQHIFVEKAHSGLIIYGILYYRMREVLK